MYNLEKRGGGKVSKIHLTKKGKLIFMGAGACIALLLVVFFLYGWLTKSNITFTTRSPVIEVHHDFDGKEIIESVKGGKVEDVEIDVSKLNKDIIGEYPVIYKYQDEKIEILVSVVDSQAPTFDVKELEIDLGMEVKPAQLVDNIQDASNTKISFKEKYDFSKVGDVKVVVVVEDDYGNKKEKKTIVHVLEKDEEAPQIQGIKDLTIRKGDKNVDYLKGITVFDTRDPNPSIVVNSKSVNLEVVGEYEIVYTARDRSGNSTKMTCVVSVVDNKVIGSPEQSSEKVLYLTFDDGPSKYTQEVLDILSKYNAKATFFVTGLNPEYFNLIKAAEEQGHTIGMHTYSHNYGEIYTSSDAYYADLNKISELCNQQIGYVPRYIRFPGGSSNTISRKYAPGLMGLLTEDVLLQGYQYYDWNVSSGDGGGTLPVSDIVAYSTASNANNIVLLAHDANGKKSTIDALPAIIEHYQSLGYRLAGLDDDSFAPHHAVNN